MSANRALATLAFAFLCAIAQPASAQNPTVTVNQAVGQADPASDPPINFTAIFSAPVTGFSNTGVSLSGTAGAATVIVTGGPSTYNLAVSGMNANGTVIVSIPAGVAVDGLANPNDASTSVDNTVTLSTTPTVTINQAAGQADPASSSPINFTVTFSRSVTGFTDTDVFMSGTAGAATSTVTGGPTIYNVAVSGMNANGTVTASIPAGVVVDEFNEPNLASTSVDNTVTLSTTPTVTINQALGQADPTATSPINFTVTFSRPVTGFTDTDVTMGGTAGAATSIVTGGPTVYNVAVSGMIANGTVTASIPAGVAVDEYSQPNPASTSTDNTVAFNAFSPTVTINQAAAQADPTAASPINFTAAFSTAVTGFTNADVSLGGTAGATTAVVTGGPTVYNVAVSGMTANGTVIASIPAGAAIDAFSAPSAASTSTDNTVTFTSIQPTVTINQAAAQADPTAASPINFTVTFSAAVTGFTNTDVTLSGTAGATTAVVTGGPAVYNVAVSGMTSNGTVIASVPAGAAIDAVSAPSAASTSTDTSVTFNGIGPTVTINQWAAQADPTAASPINFTVIFSSTVTGFTNTDVTLSGAAGATTVVVTGSSAVYNVAVSGMTANGTVIASIPAGAAVDAFSALSAASTSTDNTVTYTGASAPSTTFTGPTATGSGTATASFTGGGPACTFSNPQFIGAPPGSPPVPPVGVEGVIFPHGLFNFSTTGCIAGSTLAFTIVYPNTLPAGTQYWKYGPTAADTAPHWYVLPAAIAGNTVTFSITDGGLGDDDLVANGTLVDQGGPGVPGGALREIPTLDARALVLLVLMLLGTGLWMSRRRIK